MKKQTLFNLASMPKMVLVITLVVMLGTLFGATSYLLKAPKTDLPIINPVIEAQCETDSDCELVYVGSDVCPPCDTLSEEYQCLNKNEAKKARDKWDDRFNTDLYIVCSPCEVEFDRYVCECENGKCEKVKEELVEEVSITTDKMEYEIGEEIKITIENNSNKEQKIGYPDYFIERFKNDNWVEVRQVQCPCGALCDMVGYSFIKPKNKLEFEWDQQESWCSSGSGDWSLSEEISNQVQSGKYRIKSIKVDLNNADDKQTIYSNEFTIKEKSALDPRCSEIVKIIGNCDAEVQGYHFDLDTEECVAVNGSGCSIETPFKTLEECQEVCEKQVSISDWQTYRNEELGFEFKYPSEYPSENNIIVKNVNNYVIKILNYECVEEIHGMYCNKNRETKDDFIVELFNLNNIKGRKAEFQPDKDLEEYQGIKIFNENEFHNGFIYGSLTANVYVYKNDTNIKIYFYKNYTDDLISGILSTFKFIEIKELK